MFNIFGIKFDTAVMMMRLPRGKLIELRHANMQVVGYVVTGV